jgi:heavy metal sensor kinase
MMQQTPRKIQQIPIRVRLTAWYVLLMALTFLIAGSYLLIRFQNNLISAIDSSLQVAVSQALPGIQDEEGGLAFQENEGEVGYTAQENNPQFVMRLLSPQGAELDSLGSTEFLPSWGALEAGIRTITVPGNDEKWRIYTQPITASGNLSAGWIQAAQSLNPMTDTLQDFRDQLLWAVPFILLLAGLGGYFLADRTLRPIDRIRQTAAEIEASDLNQRIGYQGPEDEIGRLAVTFDRMLERLEAAFKRERRFAGDAAHELRTPLTVLKGQIEVTLSKSRSGQHYQDTLRELAPQVERLIRLSNALLFLSRSDQAQLPWEPEDINLGELLTLVLEQIQTLAAENQLKLISDISSEIPFNGDKDHLIRLFLNLLDNAVKYTPAGGTVDVKTRLTDQEILVSVANDGPGIPQEHLQQIFDRFHRVDSDRSSLTGGTGLGLAISREIAHLHGGTITVQSQSGNTLFSVRLPR